MIASELYIGYVVGVTFIGLFVLIAFIADVIERKNK
jgi:hypothetical protein